LFWHQTNPGDITHFLQHSTGCFAKPGKEGTIKFYLIPHRIDLSRLVEIQTQILGMSALPARQVFIMKAYLEGEQLEKSSDLIRFDAIATAIWPCDFEHSAGRIG
jgi:hypothetical protein